MRVTIILGSDEDVNIRELKLAVQGMVDAYLHLHKEEAGQFEAIGKRVEMAKSIVENLEVLREARPKREVN